MARTLVGCETLRFNNIAHDFATLGFGPENFQVFIVSSFFLLPKYFVLKIHMYQAPC